MSVYGMTGVSRESAARQRHWVSVTIGICLIMLGSIAVWAVVATNLVSVVSLGVLVLIGGIAYAVSAIRAGSLGGAMLRVVLGTLFAVAGWYLITRPALGAVTLTLAIAWLLIVGGIVHIVIAAFEGRDTWGWAVASGATSLLLGMLLWARWPVTGLFAIGLFVGIQLLLFGIAQVVAGLAPAPARTRMTAAAT